MQWTVCEMRLYSPLRNTIVREHLTIFRSLYEWEEIYLEFYVFSGKELGSDYFEKENGKLLTYRTAISPVLRTEH